MKLNHDCVRSLLLFIEEKAEINGEIELTTTQIENFTINEILYTAKKLKEAGYINATVTNDLLGNLDIIIYDITWEGHKFLDTIRDNQVWTKTKSILSKVSSSSISFVSTVASQVLSSLINQQLGLPQI